MCWVQRQELIGSLDFSLRQQKIQTEQDLLYGTEDVTASLRRTRQLMMQNIEQTHGNLSVLGKCQTVLDLSDSFSKFVCAQGSMPTEHYVHTVFILCISCCVAWHIRPDHELRL